MESNWRQSIYLLGMQFSGWELAARVAGQPIPLWIVKNRNAPGFVQLWRQLVPGQLPVLVTSAPIPPANPHFPYGAIVLPD